MGARPRRRWRDRHRRTEDPLLDEIVEAMRQPIADRYRGAASRLPPPVDIERVRVVSKAPIIPSASFAKMMAAMSQVVAGIGKPRERTENSFVRVRDEKPHDET